MAPRPAIDRLLPLDERKYQENMTGKEPTMDKQPITMQLDQLIETWNRTDCPGLVVGISYRDQILYRRAFGMANLETATANSVSTRMRIGSTSKHFLALIGLLLQEEGLLDLDKPIGSYLPELSGYNAKPTLRQLLQHRGGTRCHIDLGFIGHGMLAAPEGSGFQSLIEQTGRNFPAGDAMIYNNGGYHLVSLAAMKVTGKTLEELSRKYLFDPLQMSSTSQVPSDYVMTPGMASLHLPKVDGQWRRGLFPSIEILGEGAIVSTIDDMLRWAAHLRSQNLFGSKESWSQFFHIPKEADGSPGYYGLGIMTRNYRGVNTYRHAGGVPGGACEFVCIPDKALDIIIISNGAPGDSPALLADKVVDIILAGDLDTPPKTPLTRDYEPWLGDYASAETGMVYGLEALQDTLILRAAKYAVPAALEIDKDGWLVTGLTGIGQSRLYCEKHDNDKVGIRLRFAGHEERLQRLSSSQGLLTSPDWRKVVGRFVSHESGLSAAIELQKGKPVLQVRDRWGVSMFELLPLGGQWFHMRSQSDPDQFGAVLRFPKALSDGFVINSARTRNLPFERQ